MGSDSGKASKPKGEPDAYALAIGQWVDDALSASGMKATELVAASKAQGGGFTQAKISQYRSGGAMPTIRTLTQISALTGFDVRPLMVKLVRMDLDG